MDSGHHLDPVAKISGWAVAYRLNLHLVRFFCHPQPCASHPEVEKEVFPCTTWSCSTRYIRKYVAAPLDPDIRSESLTVNSCFCALYITQSHLQSQCHCMFAVYITHYHLQSQCHYSCAVYITQCHLHCSHSDIVCLLCTLHNFTCSHTVTVCLLCVIHIIACSHSVTFRVL